MSTTLPGKNPFTIHRNYYRRTFLIAFSLFIATLSFAQQWAVLGSESQVSATAATYTSVALLDTVPYVVYRDAAGPAKVKKRNAIGTWDQVGDNLGTNVTFPRIYTDKTNELYVSYIDAANGNRLAVERLNDTTNTWEPLVANNNLYVSASSASVNNDTRYTSTPRSSMAFDSDNNPYVAFTDGALLTPYVKKFDGTTWVTVGAGPVKATDTAVAVSLVIDETDIPWLVYCRLTSSTSTAGNLGLYRYNGGVWSAIAIPTLLPGGSSTTNSATGSTTGLRHTNMALNAAGNLVLSYFCIPNSNRATLSQYNKNTGAWNYVTTLSSKDAPNMGLISDVSRNLYCSFIDLVSGTPSSVVRVFKQSAGTTAWRELREATLASIDNSAGSLTIATGSDTTKPFIVYTKNNTAGISTPIVRAYIPPPPPAELTTAEPSNITFGSATAGGNITSDGGSPITERGIVYGTSANPTTANTKVIATTAGTGSFTVTLSSFTPATYYYVRAYAINASGTSYGSNVNLYAPATPDAVVTTARQMEFLNRGVVAVRKNASTVFVSWRMLGTEPAGIAFNVYRDGVKVNAAPVTTSTNLEDNTTLNGTYTVAPIVNGTEGTASAPAPVWATNQLAIPLQIPPGGILPNDSTYTYTANDCSVGDVDGDGVYEIFLKWEPTRKNDNAGGYSGKQIFDCYKLDGTRLWRIDLGINMNAGPHYNQFMVYDFDGDGKAEIILKTADGTKDGTGVVIGNPTVDYRNSAGWVQQGPEFLTVFNGLTGAAMATTTYEPARGAISDWGDSYGNRADRFVSAVAYLDGARPSLIVGRGYYDKLARAAYDWRNGQLTLRWKFDSKDPANPGNNAFSSMGNHQMTVGDVDGDGKDEVINGSSAINDNGKGLWTTGKGHGDALHLTDMDPDRPGLEVWQCLESPSQYAPLGIRLLGAKTGETIFGAPTTGDVGRALAADIDPNHRGYEMWSSSGNLYNVQDGQIGTSRPTNGSQSVNFGIWWDGDLGRELLDGTIIDKWNPVTDTINRLFTIYNAAPVSSNNDSKRNPCLQADLFGDWREEIILRRSNNTGLIIFTTNILTDKRIYTLMHDPQYRAAIAWQNSGYNQPPYPSFYLGYEMTAPPTPNIYLTADATVLPVKLLAFDAKADGNKVALTWKTENEKNNESFNIERSADGQTFTSIYTAKGAGTSARVNTYAAVDNHPITGLNYYRLKQTDFDSRSTYSAVKTVTFSGKENTQLVVFPNPAANTAVQLQLPASASASDLQLVVSTIEGKRILQATGTLPQLNAALNTKLKAAGTYILQVTDGAKTYTTKLAKQ